MFGRPAPYVSGSDTSREAAESVRVDARTYRGMVLAYLRGRGREGSTTDEAEVALGLRHQTCSPRFRELADAAFIIETARKRKTRSGRNAKVYVAIEFVEAEHA